MTRTYLFDMDGTLVDSLGDIGGSMNRVLRELGLPEHPIPAYRMLVGEGVRSLIEKALPPVERFPGRGAVIDDALARYRAHYAQNMMATSRPYEGVSELLAMLVARGDRVGVVTNKPHAAALRIADALFPAGTFGVVVGEREGLARKPDPALALLAAETLGASPRECVFVGDTSVDILTARAAGMRSVGVLWGFRDRDELEAAGADRLVARAEEIASIGAAVEGA